MLASGYKLRSISKLLFLLLDNLPNVNEINSVGYTLVKLFFTFSSINCLSLCAKWIATKQWFLI